MACELAAFSPIAAIKGPADRYRYEAHLASPARPVPVSVLNCREAAWGVAGGAPPGSVMSSLARGIGAAVAVDAACLPAWRALCEPSLGAAGLVMKALQVVLAGRSASRLTCCAPAWLPCALLVLWLVCG